MAGYNDIVRKPPSFAVRPTTTRPLDIGEYVTVCNLLVDENPEVSPDTVHSQLDVLLQRAITPQIGKICSRDCSVIVCSGTDESDTPSVTLTCGPHEHTDRELVLIKLEGCLNSHDRFAAVAQAAFLNALDEYAALEERVGRAANDVNAAKAHLESVTSDLDTFWRF